MKALSLSQPWATLVAIGEKQIETRGWSTPHRGTIAIHAAKRFPKAARELCFSQPFAHALLRHDAARPSELPLGAIVAVAELTHVIPTGPRGRFWLNDLSLQERAFGNYRDGRFAWFLTNIRALREPIPAKGALSLWEWQAPENLDELLLPVRVAGMEEVSA